MGVYKRGNVWWIRYTCHGEQIRESTKTPSKKVAEKLLARRETQILENRFNIALVKSSPWFSEYADEYLEKYGPETNPEFQYHVGQLINFYEGIGVMVKEGFLSMRLVALSWAGAIRVFWEKFEPIMGDLCEYYDYPRLWSETIYLCRELMKYMDEHPELKT